jgi:hypothetical protein
MSTASEKLEDVRTAVEEWRGRARGVTDPDKLYRIIDMLVATANQALTDAVAATRSAEKSEERATELASMNRRMAKKLEALGLDD